MPARLPVPLLLVAFAFVGLTTLAMTDRLVPGEASIARSLQDVPLGHAIEDLSDVLASPLVEYTLIAATAAAALRARLYWLAATALLALLGMALNPAIKELVQRERPTGADLTVREHPGGFGFPSGHVQSATLAYGYAAASVARLMPPRTAVAATLAAMITITAIGFNRVYNGVHWPSDVAGGALLGALLVVAAYRLPEWIHRRLAAGEIGGAPGNAELG